LNQHKKKLALDCAVLATLSAGGPAGGAQLRSRVSAVEGRDVTCAELGEALERLAGAKMVWARTEISGAGRRPRVVPVYALTPAGTLVAEKVGTRSERPLHPTRLLVLAIRVAVPLLATSGLLMVASLALPWPGYVFLSALAFGTTALVALVGWASQVRAEVKRRTR